ncbi:hypothetical protein ACHAPY_000896 [Fusarium culmorum]
MFFFFVCGEHTFRKEVPGYEGMPLIPLSISGYTDVACRICNFHQPLENRPDVKAMANGGGPPQQQWGPPQGAPQGQQPMRYG